jgi:hypothetical protein
MAIPRGGARAAGTKVPESGYLGILDLSTFSLMQSNIVVPGTLCGTVFRALFATWFSLSFMLNILYPMMKILAEIVSYCYLIYDL